MHLQLNVTTDHTFRSYPHSFHVMEVFLLVDSVHRSGLPERSC